ncbi:DUF4990 domain-containing protein [Catenovulum sp. 2E275]|uniref:right-handed parallel beta-helix repeat-containing protein n=1 Tax=Catenovulum sp. 2E275 TaxID=2980497 RepID=UPI0021D03DB4|nr:DUF4990 domain-containing protein [Catenovulum sp. 2E275]MCU4675241.1 DUF4990 domain-containing protein [Catenovulum sp. 2E275]
MKLNKYVMALSWLSFLPLATLAADFYIAPNGSDTNAGSLSAPFATIMAAQNAASAGDTVYLRGGTYYLDNSNITSTDSARSYVNTIDKDGIRYIAYQGERPVFDFTNVKPQDLRVVAFLIEGDDNVFQGFDITGVQITIDYKRTQSTAIRVNGGDRNLFENLAIYDNMAIGWYLAKGSDNLVLNVDAYRNKGLDANSHGNIDGFGAHPDTSSSGNIIRGSRAWFNSDDGFDFISANTVVTVENSWAFYNGYDADFNSLGDGNGFKAGGYGRDGKIDFPTNPVPRHIVKNCLAVGNKSGGFYANHHIDGQDWINNTAIANRYNYNMLSTTPDNTTDVPGYSHYMRNNLGFDARSSEVANLGSAADNDLSHNYFDLAVTVTADDFISLDESQLTAPRKANGDLPDITYAHLSQDSDLIDAGTDIGSPYNGTSPDLGAFESAPTAPTGLTTSADVQQVNLSWDASAETYFTGYNLYRSTTQQGPFEQIAADLTSSSYTDSSVQNATEYFYVVTTVVEGGEESAYSNLVSATPLNPLPASVVVQDIMLSSFAKQTPSAKVNWIYKLLGLVPKAHQHQKQAQATITIVNNLGETVSGAKIYGQFNGSIDETVQGITDEHGVAVLTSKKSAKGDLTLGFKVTQVIADLSFDDAQLTSACRVF